MERDPLLAETVEASSLDFSGGERLRNARRYCRRLARSHYENFIVASLFLPRKLHQHFYNIYAYCRVSDDLADESRAPSVARRRLDQWREELIACFRGQPRHPVFVALWDTIQTFDIPIEPFLGLLRAFQLDQVKNRYQSYEELLDYCNGSANPVGHLVLYLFGYRDRERQALSDCTCTALQLANHWQDIARDLHNLNRIYLPLEDLERFHYTEEDLQAHRCDERFRALMEFEVKRARTLFERGLGLCSLVRPRLALQIELFNRGGLEVLRLIEGQDFDIFSKRPVVGMTSRLIMLVRAARHQLVRVGRGRSAGWDLP